MDTDKFLADLLDKHQRERRRKTSLWDVQYFSKSAGGWVLFKEYEDEEEAFCKAEILAEGISFVRIIEFTPDEESVEVWRSQGRG